MFNMNNLEIKASYIVESSN